MKIHWRTEDRMFRSYQHGFSVARIAWIYLDSTDYAVKLAVEDAIRHAILRRERKRGSRAV